ncbi:MAG TPA: M12 family metallopeptidase [Candidatus Binatia bacterium]|nr:M12 family metallopeptidase [Candidatus Binatia bacterium]
MARRICFDRVLPRDLRRTIRFRAIPGAGGRTRAITPIGKLWMNGSTLRVRFVDGTPAQQETVRQFAPRWTDHANLHFEFGHAPDAEIRIAFADDGAWSYVGTDARGIPAHEPTMNFGWLDEAVVLHEFGHAIGLAHEHQNPAGGIQWNEPVVIRDLSGPPNRWDEATIRHNVLAKYEHDQVNGTEFDPQSIMLYSFPADWTLNGFQSEPNMKLSLLDQSFAASARMYPGRAAPEETELTVAEIEGVEASIGQPGEEDLYTFQATRPGRYTVETTGPTDLVMKLFGPESRTRLVAQDDDGGQGTNPRILADLSPGRYFVQIRHYEARGTGAYTVKVYR